MAEAQSPNPRLLPQPNVSLKRKNPLSLVPYAFDLSTTSRHQRRTVQHRHNPCHRRRHEHHASSHAATAGHDSSPAKADCSSGHGNRAGQED